MDAQHRGLILIAHGARDPRWAEPLQRTADLVRAHSPGLEVALAFLEFIAPDLPACGAQLVAAGCSEVDILPLFLGAGGHVRQDLPLMVDALRQRYPAVQWHLHRAVGEADVVVRAMADAALGLDASTRT
jgi:sirohydrochlorin cobaltochelatase